MMNITKNGRSKRNRRGTRRLSFSISFHLSPLRGTFFEKLRLSPPHGSISLRVARSEELGTLLDLVLDVDHPVEPPVSLLSFVSSEEHTSELQSLMRISYAVFFLKKNKKSN